MSGMARRPRPLTKRQAAILRTLRQYVRLTGEPMRLRVLARSLGITPEGARHHLLALAAKGYTRAGTRR